MFGLHPLTQNLVILFTRVKVVPALHEVQYLEERHFWQVSGQGSHFDDFISFS
jgi:hypothetical protein